MTLSGSRKLRKRGRKGRFESTTPLYLNPKIKSSRLMQLKRHIKSLRRFLFTDHFCNWTVFASLLGTLRCTARLTVYWFNFFNEPMT